MSNKLFIKTKNTWEKVGDRPATIWGADRIVLGINKGFKNLLGTTFKKRVIIFIGKHSSWYARKKDLDKIKALLVIKLQQSNFSIEERSEYNSALLSLKEVIINLKKFSNKDLAPLSKKFLLKMFANFNRSFINFSHYGLLSLLVDSALTPQLRKRFEQLNLSEKQTINYITTLTTPSAKTETFKEKIDFLKIAYKFIERNNIDEIKVRKEIKKHFNKYCWLPVFYSDEFYTEEYFYKNLQDKIKDKNIKKELLETKNYLFFLKKRQVKIKTKLKKFGENGRSMIKLTNLINYYGHRRTVFAETVGMANYYILPLTKEIARRIKIASNEIQFLTSNEIINSIQSNRCIISKKEIKRRMINCVLIQKNQLTKVLTGKNYNKIKKLVEEKTLSKDNIKFIKGLGASPGLVKGRVKIIRTIKEIYKFKQGEILVAPMTTVDYMIAVRRASAIITDEGGITSHAAIISRELKIPCVVGTKIATKILNDNDVVEVNADEGIITIK